MSTIAPTINRRSKRGVRAAIAVVLAVVLIVAMAFSTKVVKIGSASDAQVKAFDPAVYGEAQFPKTQSAIEGKAVSADTLAAAIAKDQDAAGKQYGVAGGGIGPEISVKFDGVAGSEDAGLYTVKVPNVPDRKST